MSSVLKYFKNSSGSNIKGCTRRCQEHLLKRNGNGIEELQQGNPANSRPPAWLSSGVLRALKAFTSYTRLDFHAYTVGFVQRLLSQRT